MSYPFHTKHCREGWGCPSSCPVRQLVEEHDRLKVQLAKLDHPTKPKTTKKADNG
jgi:hypothetical protein